MPDRLQLAPLPDLTLQHIVLQVAGLGAPTFGNLRLCSHAYRAFCDGHLPSLEIAVEHLSAAGPWMSRLIKLENLTIQGSISGSMLKSDALTSVTANLSRLTLTSMRNYNAFTYMRVENASKVLLPWCLTLQSLHLVRCDVTSSAETSLCLSQPGFFSMFPFLEVLKLNNITATPALTALSLAGCSKLHTLKCCIYDLLSLDVRECSQLVILKCSDCATLSELDVSACTELEVFKCGHNQILALDVTSCTNLIDFRCEDNRLSELDVSCCYRLEELWCWENCINTLDLSQSHDLKVLRCESNSLQTVFLPDVAELHTLCLEDNENSLEVLGCAMLYKLSCDASTFCAVTPVVRAEVRHIVCCGRIALEEEFVLEGLRAVQWLTCDSGAALRMDMTGCVSKELTINTSFTAIPYSFTVSCEGPSEIQKLVVSKGAGMADFSSFTQLTELHVNLANHKQRTLDLSACSSLRKVHLEDDGRSMMEAINLT